MPPPASTEYSEPGVTVVYVGGTVVVVDAVLGGSVLPAAATDVGVAASVVVAATVVAEAVGVTSASASPGRGPAGAPLGAWPQ